MAYYPEIATLADVSRYHARRRGGEIALVFADHQTSYAEWDRHCSRVANGLLAGGSRRGSRVGFMGKNSDRYFEIVFGCFKAGAVMVPISWRLAAPEIAYIVADAEIEFLFLDSELLDKIAGLRAHNPQLKEIIAMSANDLGLATYETWRDLRPAEDPFAPCDPDDVALQLYTSGTTGHPKGVQLPHRNFFQLEKARIEGPNPDDPIWEWNVWGPEDSSLLTMPCFHISGTGWGLVGLYSGARTVVLKEFSEEAVLDAIETYKITKLILVPTAIQMVVRHPKARITDFSSLKYLCYGASPIPLDVLKDAIKTFDCRFVQMYGLTETTGAVTFLPAQDHDVNGNRRMRSTGRATYGVTIKIVNEAGERLPPGEVGEICIKSPTIMRGYWNQPEETKAVIMDDGWLRSGDAGYMDEDGYVYMQDRVKDMIVSGGVNIYPAEIENALYGHPDVAEVAVIGVPDVKWGEAVKAVIVPRPGTRPTSQAILSFARRQIADFKVPKSIDFVDSLPRNASGKILKRELRKPFWEGRERQVN